MINTKEIKEIQRQAKVSVLMDHRDMMLIQMNGALKNYQKFWGIMETWDNVNILLKRNGIKINDEKA